MKNRTHVDDATGSAHDKENAMRISQDRGGIIENGGFKFKETIRTGNMLDRTGELRKVLGLRWDIERDMYVKINYGKKKKGAYIEGSEDLSCL